MQRPALAINFPLSMPPAMLPKVALLSPGEMGAGIAVLLSSYSYHVITNITSRSPETHTRAIEAGIELATSDVTLLNDADIILSIVPPADALHTARRVSFAYTYCLRSPERPALVYIDLNAVSPQTAKKIAAIFKEDGGYRAHEGPGVKFLDGAIFGHPPRRGEGGGWCRPRIAVSGDRCGGVVEGLLEALNGRWVGEEVGMASGLKMCFSALTKGLAALAIQSFTTASTLHLLPALYAELSATSSTSTANPLLPFIENMLAATPRKSHRWIHEMEEINTTFKTAGFDGDMQVFERVKEVFVFLEEEEEEGSTGVVGRKEGEATSTVEGVLEGIEERLRVRKDKAGDGEK